MKKVFQTMSFTMLTDYVSELSKFINTYGEQSGRSKRMLNIATGVLNKYSK